MRKTVIVLMSLFILLNLFIVILSFYSLKPSSLRNSSGTLITGRGTSGTVGLVILGPELNVFIHSPENITYNFSIGDDYIIDLNVSADFTVDTWWYKLEDLRHGTTVNESVVFTPNDTINAVRWSNKITVFANDSSGSSASSSVIFFVSVPNSAPVLGAIDDGIFVCESNSLSYSFSASDADEDDLTADISPKNPFFVSSPTRINLTTVISSIFSGNLTKSDVGIYSEVVSVSDGEYVDTKNTNITVIEINNAPSVENVGVQTIYTQGDNSTFYKEVQVSDVENGNQSSGNFTFNLTFLNGNKFFDITQFGVMNVSGNDSIIGVYNLSLCVTDKAIENIHQNISLCGQDGLNQTVCQNFSLTVTDENRAPTITNYYPSNFSLSISGTGTLSFNITKYDPDGTIPDTYWYVDGFLKEYDSGSSYDKFEYSFGCGVSGTHTIKAEITDGLLNDSVEWTVSVERVQCPLPSEGGGGGGGGGIEGCATNWACDTWEVCQNAKASLEIGLLSGEDYRTVKDSCLEQNLDDSSCGVQIRKCFDLNSCNSSAGQPPEFQGCYYLEKPSCFDNVKNCHDGDCELLVDCGGPCDPCPTCSDGIQNQGEQDVDCGGPCPWKCPAEKPLQANKIQVVLFWSILIMLVLLAIIKVIKIVKLREKLIQIKRNIMKNEINEL